MGFVALCGICGGVVDIPLTLQGVEFGSPETGGVRCVWWWAPGRSMVSQFAVFGEGQISPYWSNLGIVPEVHQCWGFPQGDSVVGCEGQVEFAVGVGEVRVWGWFGGYIETGLG